MSLGPRALARPRDAGGTLTGVLGGGSSAIVDGAGLVSPVGVRWSLDWWIGGEDRWYLPAREATTRQRRLGSGPVLETMISLPGGNARHLAYGASVGGQEVTVVEVHNDSPVPVALALALRPYSWSGESASELVLALDDQVLSVDGVPVLVLPRPPSAAGGSGEEDLLATVLAHDALSWDGGTGDGGRDVTRGPAANAVVVYPLPHRTSLRLLVLGAGAGGLGAGGVWSGPDPSQAPEVDGVSRGWMSIVNAGGRLEYPDDGITRAVGGARARLLLTSSTLAGEVAALRSGSGAVLKGLALGGHRSEIGPVLDALAEAFPTRLDDGALAGAEVVAALGAALDAVGRRPQAELLESAVQITHLVERSGEGDHGAMARRGLARLASLSGDDVGAAHLAQGAPRVVPSDLATVVAMMEGASSTDTWNAKAGADGGAHADDPVADDPVAAARFVAAARSLLIDDDGDDLVLLPGFAPAWRGGNVEVHQASTRFGRLSFGIRWHGARPALLWQLDGARSSTMIRCPDLDPDWSTTETRGETLLVGSDLPLPTAPQAGDSFS